MAIRQVFIEHVANLNPVTIPQRTLESTRNSIYMLQLLDPSLTAYMNGWE